MKYIMLVYNKKELFTDKFIVTEAQRIALETVYSYGWFDPNVELEFISREDEGIIDLTDLEPNPIE